MDDYLTKDVSNQEILDAIKQISPLKALGPDGMQAIFYQKNWDIVEKSVCKMVRAFFHSKHMLGELDRTHITVIPKLRTRTMTVTISLLVFAIFRIK